MKKHTTIFYSLFVAVLVLAAPLAAEARPGGPGSGGPGGCFQPLTQEQRDTLGKLMREHQEKMQPIRDQLWAKSRILDAFSGSAKVEPKDIETLVKEMASLRIQLREGQKAFDERVKKETGIDMPGCGSGMGMGGMGCGCSDDDRGPRGDRHGDWGRGDRGHGGKGRR